MSEDNIWIQLGINLSGIFGGLFAGHYLTIWNEKHKDKEMLGKIHYLLNADFTLINRLVTRGQEEHREWYNALMDDNGALYYSSDLNVARDAVTALGMKIGNFTYWDSIMSSGGFIRLEPDELRIISTAHRVITTIKVQQDDTFQRFSLDLLKRLFEQPKTPQERVQIMKAQCKLHFMVLFQAYGIIEKHVKLVQSNIGWIDMKAEPIVELKQPVSKTLQAQPYVRNDGITVYPDGTEVDRKGTIIKNGHG